MGSSKKIVSAVIWTTVLNIVNAVYGFISVPILITHFGKAEYGIIGLAMSVNVYLRLMDMGFNQTNVRFFSTWLAEKNSEKVKTAFQTSLVFYGTIGLINGIIILIVALFSDSIFNVTPEQNIILKNLFYILSITAFCSWFSSCFDQLIRATENVAWIQRRTLLTKVLIIAVLFITVYGNLSIEIYYVLTCLATLSIVPLSIGKIKEQIPYVNFIPRFYKDVFKEMLPYSLHIFSFSMFQFTFFHLRPVFLGMQGTMESIADYRVLNGITALVQMLGGAFVGVLLPSTSKIVAQHNMEAYYRVAYDGTKYISILKSFCCFGLMSIGASLLTLYIGEQYLYLIPWLNLWLILLLGSHNQAISSLIFAGADVKALSYSSAVASTLGLIVSWFLIPVYQVGGVIIGYVAYTIVQQLFFYTYYWPKKMHIDSWRVFTRSFIPYILLGVLCYILCQYIPSTGNIWADLIICSLSFVISFSFFLICMLNNKDRKFIMSIITKKK